MDEYGNQALPQLVFPENGYVFDTHTEEQKSFICDVKTVGIDKAIQR